MATQPLEQLLPRLARVQDSLDRIEARGLFFDHDLSEHEKEIVAAWARRTLLQEEWSSLKSGDRRRAAPFFANKVALFQMLMMIPSLIVSIIALVLVIVR